MHQVFLSNDCYVIFVECMRLLIDFNIDSKIVHYIFGKVLFLGHDQCDQIGRFIGLWATF